MMKNIKKFMAITLSLLMIISAMPLTAGAADEEVIEWKAGTGYTVILENGTVGVKTDIGNVYGETAVLSEWTNRFITYTVTPSLTGTYLLEVEAGTNERKPNYLHAYVNDEEIGTLYIEDGGWITFTEGMRKVGTFTAQEGTPLKLAFNNPRTDINTDAAIVCIRNIRLTYLSPAELESSSIEDGETVPVSTDVITLDFSRELDGEKLTDASVSLTDSGLSELGFTLEAEEDKLNIILNDSLKYEESYTLTFSGIKDKDGTMTGEQSISFNTADKDNDSSPDNSSVCIDADSEGIIFTLSGQVVGSRGQGISGRKVELSLTTPDGSDTSVIGVAVSDESGNYTFTYELGEEYREIGGEYIFTANAEFSQETSEDKARYISAGQKLLLLGTLEECTGYADVQAFFEEGTNGADLGTDITSLSELDNAALFYDRLAKASYRNADGEYDIKVFEKVWNISYSLEMINQKDSNEITASYLENEDFAAAIGLSTERYLAVVEKKDELISAVTALERQETAKIFGNKVNELVNEYLMLEKGKTNLSVSLVNKSVYVGETAVVPLKLTSPATDIKEYKLEVMCSSSNSAEKIMLEALSGASVSKEVSGNTAVFAVTNTEEVLSDLGSLEYSGASVGTETVRVSGNVIYETDGLVINAEILQANVQITIKKNQSKGGSGSTSGFSSSFAPKPQNPVTAPTEEKPQDTAIFTDTDDVAWAVESIELLFKKGIISKAEDGRFRPNDSVTRAEFVKMLTTAMRISDKSAPVELNDVTESDWYYTYVSAAVNYGLVLGDDKGNFRPDDRITRQDICVIVSRAMDKLGYGEAEAADTLFTDDESISDYAKTAVYRMRTHEIVNGMGDGSFAPLNDATRAATAKIIDAFMKEAKI